MNRTNKPKEIIRDLCPPPQQRAWLYGLWHSRIHTQGSCRGLACAAFWLQFARDEDGPEVAVNLGGIQEKQNKTKQKTNIESRQVNEATR